MVLERLLGLMEQKMNKGRANEERTRLAAYARDIILSGPEASVLVQWKEPEDSTVAIIGKSKGVGIGELGVYCITHGTLHTLRYLGVDAFDTAEVIKGSGEFYVASAPSVSGFGLDLEDILVIGPSSIDGFMKKNYRLSYEAYEAAVGK